MKLSLTRIVLSLLCCLLFSLSLVPVRATVSSVLPQATTVTVYPSEGTGNASAVDGDIGTNFNLSYTAAQSTANCVDCSSVGFISCENSVGKVNGVDAFSIIRAVVNFDTGFLGADAQILSATFFVKPTNIHFDFTFGDFIRLTSNSLPSTNTYTVNDYGLVGSSGLAPDVPVSMLVTNQYSGFQLNATGLAAINKTGVTRFGLRAGGDVNNQQPVCGTDESFPDKGGTVIFFYSADTPGTSADPKLVITYTSGSPFTASIAASPAGGTPPLTVNLSINASQPVTGVVWRLNGVQFSTSIAPSLIMPTVGTHRIDAFVSSGGVTINAFTFITVQCPC